MLDTHARRFIEPLVRYLARVCRDRGISANQITLSSLAIGVLAALLVTAGYIWTGIVALWISGLLDATDGTLARMTRPSPLGAIMDITFDRVVELSIVFALAWRFPQARLTLVIVAGVIAIAMSLFLSIAAALRNSSVKSFHYAPGLGERSEAFICLSLMIAFPVHLIAFSWLFIAMMVFTMWQRLRHVSRFLHIEP